MAVYANVLSRALAVIIDHVLLMIVTILITLPFGFATAMFSVLGRNPLSIFANMGLLTVVMLVSIIIWILYFTYFESKTGQTLGKKIVNIKVTKENGKNLTMEEALLRTILRVIDGLAFYLIGFIVILITDKRQRLGDIAAKTIVIKA